jgi:hypothetical protein
MRRASMLEMTIDVEVEYTQAAGGSRITERTVADRILPSGARLLLKSAPNQSDRLGIQIINGNFHALSIIKEVSSGSDGIWRVTIEFLGNSWKRAWLYPREPKELIYEELLDCSKNTYQILQEIQQDLQSGAPIDFDSLSVCKKRIDELRKAILNTQQTFLEE